MSFKDFDAAKREREPITFQLGGHLFTVPVVPAPAVLDLAAKAQQEGPEAVSAFGAFLYACVEESAHDELTRALNTLDLPGLVELASWLMEEASGRPLPNVLSSPEDASTGTPPSRVVSLSPVAATP